jgi:hypothetical protein
MVAAPLTARRPVLMHHPLGASTGFMVDERGDWEALVEEACRTSVFTTELSALGEDELPGLLDYLVRHGRDVPFRYLSVHAPSKRLTMREADRVALLARLPAAVDAIVVHPDTMDDPALYGRLGDRLVLENMDARKCAGRSADELAGLFEALPLAGLCFDVAHAWSVDPGMALGHELLDRFGDRLRHVHLSSLHDDGAHGELRPADEELFAPLLARCRDVPWILEAAPPIA